MPSASYSPANLGSSNANINSSNASESIRRLKEISRKLMEQTRKIGPASGEATVKAIMAVWAMVMAILRYLGKIFGSKKNQAAPAETSAEADDDFAKPKVTSSPTPAAAAVQPRPESSAVKAAAVLPENAINEMASEAQSLLKTMQDQPQAGALLQALNYAGIDDAAFMLEWVEKMGDPSALKGPAHVIDAALSKGLEALTALEEHTLLARSVRTQEAAKLSAKFASPMLLEDLVSLYRTGLEKGRISSADMTTATALVQADDALKNILGHSNVIRETLTVAAASAQKAGVDLEDKSVLLKQVLGADWAKKIDAAHAEIEAAETVHPDATKIFSDLLEKIAPPSRPVNTNSSSASTPSSSADAAQVASPLKTSTRDRLRAASAAANQFLQSGGLSEQLNQVEPKQSDDMEPKP